MLPAIVIEKLPRLIRAIRLTSRMPMPTRRPGWPTSWPGITAMVAEKFTNDRTAEGIQRAQLLTVGGVSLGLEQLLIRTTAGRPGRARLPASSTAPNTCSSIGFRLISELSALPEDTLVGEYDNDPVYSARRLKELFVDICTADPSQTWSGCERYLGS